MAMNPLYNPESKSGGDFGPDSETWWPKNDGDKIRGTIVYVGEVFDRKKPDKWIKADDPEWKKVTKNQKVVIDVDGKMFGIYVSGFQFKLLGRAMAEHDIEDFNSDLIGWKLGFKWDGFEMVDGKPAKKQEFKLFPPKD